jgi:hypothetical protein
LIRAGPLNRASSFCWAKLLFVSHLFRDFGLERDSCFNFCICECIYIAIVRVPEVCKRAYSQSVTAYRWNDVMIIISKWRFIEGWIKHQTQSKQRHFTSLNMTKVESVFLASIWTVSSFNTQCKRNDRNFYRQTNYWLMALRYYYETMKLWK